MVVFLNSCIPHQAYVASSFEPIVVEKKKDMQAAVSFRPFKYIDINGTYALTNHLAVRTDFGGFVGVYNLSGSLIYFNNLKKIRYYIAPTFNYQNNQITRKFRGIFGDNIAYNYFCIYNGIGTSVGVSKKMKEYDLHFNLKTQYNIVENFYFHYYRDNGSKDDRPFVILDNEVCNVKMPNFLSIEPSVSFIVHNAKKSNLKVQIGLSICERKYIHEYSYATNKNGSEIKTNKNYHPTYLPMYVSIGYIFSNKKETLPIEN